MEDAILNFSRIEDDPFADISLDARNITETPNEYYLQWQPTTFEAVLNYTFFACQILNFVLAIGAVVADFLIIFLIFRYKRLRKSLNLYIAHYAIFSLIYYILTPIYVIFFILFSSGFDSISFLFCALFMFETVILFMTFFLAFLLAIDWTVSHCDLQYKKQIVTVFNHKFLVIYGLFGLLVALGTLSCIFEFKFGHRVLSYTFLLSVVILLGLHYIRRHKTLSTEHLKTEYALWVSTIAIGCYVPIFLIDTVFSFLVDYSTESLLTKIWLLAEYFFSLFSTPASIFVLYYLIKWNKYFKMALDTTFKRNVRTYGADNLDDGSDNEDIVENGVDRNVNTNINEPDTPHILP